MPAAAQSLAGGAPVASCSNLPEGTLAHEASWGSSAYRRTIADIRRFARDRDAAVLLEGECGTGKTRLGRHLHAISERRQGPYVRADLAALPDDLAGSELFGHVRGAFTGAGTRRAGLFVTASGGTLLLDEIGKASPYVQQTLLHAIEYGEVRPLGADRDVIVDARIVAATNVPLDCLVACGKFLIDLHARLLLFRVIVPPLRHRREDIPRLVEQSIATHATRCGYRIPPAVEPELMRALEGAPWPYNIRQLDATVRRLLIEAEAAPELTLRICRGDLAYLREWHAQTEGAPCESLEELIRENGVTGAAELLGVHRTTIHRRLKRK